MKLTDTHTCNLLKLHVHTIVISLADGCIGIYQLLTATIFIVTNSLFPFNLEENGFMNNYHEHPRVWTDYQHAYHCDSNTILQAPFVNRQYKHRILAYNSIMKILADKGHHVEVQILDNEVSAKLKKTVVKYWGAKYQLVPPNVHRRNIAERAI